jgi:hypothetical protein
VLVENAGVLDGQLPSAEVDHLSAELMLHGMERGLLQRSFDHGSLRKGSVLYNAFQEPARERRA